MKSSTKRLFVCALAFTWACASTAPDWVAGGGKSSRHPAETYLTGFAAADGIDAAKSRAAADLAQRIQVRVEKETSDVSIERDGEYRYAVAAVTRASTDIRLSGLSYEIFQREGEVLALAILERAAGAAARRRQRDDAMNAARACIETADEHRGKGESTEALARYLSCRRTITEALEHETIAVAIAGAGEARDELFELSHSVDGHVRTLLKKNPRSIREAADLLGTQLQLQGVSKSSRLTIAPLTFGTTPFSSVFGRRIAVDLERALASGETSGGSGDVSITGTYFDIGKAISIRLIARQTENGRALASADTSISLSAIPKNLSVKPQNLQEALVDQNLLAFGEEVSGSLRVEVWTNKGKERLLFEDGEELRIFFRVNQPAYVRLIYLLASGTKVPLEQSYFVDASKVNKAVEYPDIFEAAPPFGIEQLFAVAFTEEPAPLETTTQVIEGQQLEVVANTKALVRHRGIRRKSKTAQTAESVITLTTVPR